MIAWCSANLPFATFNANRLHASLPYPDESFDFVYGLSVFTHLGESHQRDWTTELARVLKPNALLYLTFNGEAQLELGLLDEEERQRFAAGELVVKSPELSGGNFCIAFHPRMFLERLFPPQFELVEFIAQGARDSRQDVALLRRAAMS
jgi:SAM-dependent methyltransferase